MTLDFHKVDLNRRTLLKGLGSAISLPVLASCGRLSYEDNQEHWLSAAGSNKDSFSLSWTHGLTKNTDSLLSGFRGHGLTKHPINKSIALMFSRRPGNQAILMDLKTKKMVGHFTSPDHLYMEGHGCFSHDGRFLFCTESNKQTHQGIITVRETTSYKVIKEIPSGGIGPHEIQIMPNQNTLVIANGGLIKDSKGHVINTQSMKSNITFLNYDLGKILSTYDGEHSQASLRHLDISNDGIVAIAMQAQVYNPERLMPLTSLINKDGSKTVLNAPDHLLKKLNGYVGSVRINNKYRTAAFTSPRGDIALFWNIDNGVFLGQQFFHNVCGLTVSTDEEYFVLSNSAGKIRQIHASTLVENTDLRRHFPSFQWDNHMITVGS